MGSGKQQDYTPFDKVRVHMLGGSRKRLDEALVGINNRDPRWHDVHLLNIKTGELKLVMKGDGYAGFETDDDLQVRLAFRSNAAGGTDYFQVKDSVVADKPFLSTSLEDSRTSPLGYTADGKTLYWMDSRDRETTAVFAEDAATGQRKLIAQDPRVDIHLTLRHPITGEMQAFSVNYLINEWQFVDAGLKADFDWLQRQLGKGDVFVASRTRDDEKWIVGFDPVSRVAATYLYERKAKRLTALYVARPDLQGAPLVPMLTAEIRARDGLILPSYLTLPPGTDTNGDGKADKAVPMVLLVYGGPWARDGYGYNGTHQWLANRGYAVLSVNFRGSTGFGKTFQNAGNKQWGLAMHNDLLDAVDWAVKQGVTSADNGANDPRVKQAESDQIVTAMQAKKIPVTYVLYPDEGHGFAKPNNRIGFNAVAEAFLGNCLDGRVEPLAETIRESTAQVVHGAEHVPGLKDAAARK